MKQNFVRVILAICASVMLILATGCANQGQHLVSQSGDPSKICPPDIRVDRVVTKSAATEGTILETDVTQVVLKNPDCTPRFMPDGKGGLMPAVSVMIKERTTNPLGNDLAKLATAPTISGIAGYKTGVRVAEEVGKGGCSGSGCGTQFFVQGGNAASLAAADSKTSAAVNAVLGTCQNGGCQTPIPMKID